MLLPRLKDNPLVNWLHLGSWTQQGYALPVIPCNSALLCESAVKEFKHR
jgi:hypothetical protein